MVHQLIQNYNEFLNRKIENSTYVVLLITGLVVASGILAPQKQALAAYSQANIIGVYNEMKSDTIIMIEGVEYRITFEKLR